MISRTGYVLLEDGMVFGGEMCAARGHAVGEVVFTTGMSGYQESMTDPSFAGQLLAFTYPHIGNYGASAEAMESERVAGGGAHLAAEERAVLEQHVSGPRDHRISFCTALNSGVPARSSSSNRAASTVLTTAPARCRRSSARS